MNNKVEMFVFWEYDQYPYTLGAVALSRPNGMWYAPSYQMTVKPLAVYEVEIGKGISAELQNLRRQREATLKALDLQYRAMTAEYAPFLKTK